MGEYRCPVETAPGLNPRSCIMNCPPLFQLRTVNGAQRCMHTVNTNVYASLIPQAAVRRTDSSPFEINDLDPSSSEYIRYSAEKERFAADIARATTLVSTQVTPGVNDQYAAEVEAATDKFISEYQFLQNQAMQQQSTLDIVTSVKDKMFGVKDDMEHSVGIFAKQISDIRNQINVNKTTRRQATDYGKWMELALNFAIVLALLFLIFVIGRKAMSGASLPASSGTLGAPARPPASEHTVELLKGLTGLLGASSSDAKKS